MKNFTLSVLSVALAATSFAADAPAMRSLFNGKDLTGWTGEGYIVEDGAIVCTPDGKNLVTEQTFSSYVLEFEFKLPPGGNNGLGIHYPGTGDGAYTGMEIQILDNTDPKYGDLKEYQFHGSLYTLAAAKKTGLKPVGEWNHQRVSVLGSGIIVELNGETILRANLDALSEANPKHEGAKRRAGHIGWLGHGDRVSFKNIKILETPPAANVEGVMAAGFKPIFDGRTLAGWKNGSSQEWAVANGIIKHSGKPGKPSDLWTEKEYGDCTLVFDWRWSARGPLKKLPTVLPDGSNKLTKDGQPELTEAEDLDSGVYFRGNIESQVNLWNWSIGSGEIYGYRMNSALSAAIKAAVTPTMKADSPIGEWNRTMVTLKGDRVSVSLNGRLVIENAQLPGVPARGAIGLQHHGSAIDFANLWIKEL